MVFLALHPIGISHWVVEPLGVITAISHALFETPRKSQFIFMAHTTTQTSVVCCFAKYFVMYTHSKMKNT